MLSCQQVTERASDYLEGRMNFWQRVKFRAHLRACVHCDRFLRHLRIAIRYYPEVAHQCASPAEVEKVLARIENLKPTD